MFLHLESACFFLSRSWPILNLGQKFWTNQQTVFFPTMLPRSITPHDDIPDPQLSPEAKQLIVEWICDAEPKANHEDRTPLSKSINVRAVACIGTHIIQLSHYNSSIQQTAIHSLLQLPSILTASSSNRKTSSLVPPPPTLPLLNGAHEYISIAEKVVATIAPALVHCQMAVAVVVYLEGLYHHPSLAVRDVAVVAAAQIACQAPLDVASKATAFCNLCYMLDHRELLSGQRVSILKAISRMAKACLEFKTFALGAQTLQRIMTLHHKTKEECVEAKHAVASVLSTPATAAAEWTQVFVSLLSGSRHSDNNDILYPVLKMFVSRLPGGEKTLKWLLSGMTTATTASDPAVRHGAALGLLAILDGCENNATFIKRILQLQPNVFVHVVTGCLDDDIGIRSMYIQCLSTLASALDMIHVIKDLQSFQHEAKTEKTKAEEKEEKEEQEEQEEKEEQNEQDTANEQDEHTLHASLTLITSTHALEHVVKKAIEEHGAVVDQQYLTHMISSSEMLHLSSDEKMLRMRRIRLWMSTLEVIDPVFLQQLLLTLEDPHPNVFMASLEIFESLTHLLGLPDNIHMISTIYAYLSKQLQVRRMRMNNKSNNGSSTSSTNEAALMTSMVQCLTSLPLHGLEKNTLLELLIAIAQLMFTPGLSAQARTSIICFVCDPSRDVESTPWPKNDLINNAIAVLLLGLGDDNALCVKACLAGIHHLTLYTTKDNPSGNSSDRGVKTMSWLEQLIQQNNIVEHLTNNSEGSGSGGGDLITVYSILATSVTEHAMLQEYIYNYAQIGIQAFKESSSRKNSSSSSSPSHNVAWISMLSHRLNKKKSSTSSSSDSLNIEPSLSLLTSSHGLASTNVHMQQTASECLVQCCTKSNLFINFQIVGQLASLARSYLLDESHHLKRGAVLLLTKMIPYHFHGFNVWLVGESGVLRRILVMMTRSHSIEVRIQSIAFVREILLAVPSTISRSGLMHSIWSHLRECFAHTDPIIQASVADMYPIAFYHNEDDDSSNASSHYLFSDLTSDSTSRMVDPVLSMLGPRQLRNLYSATMEALGLMVCSSNEAITTIAETLRHRLRTNDPNMRAQATRAFIFQCNQLSEKDASTKRRMLANAIPLCHDPILQVRRALYQGLDQCPSRLIRIVNIKEPEVEDSTHDVSKFMTKAKQMSLLQQKRQNNQEEEEEEEEEEAEEEEEEEEEEDIDEMVLGCMYGWEKATKVAGETQRVIPMREKENRYQKKLQEQQEQQEQQYETQSAIDGSENNGSQFTVQDWSTTLSLTDGSLLTRIQQLCSVYVTAPLPTSTAVAQEDEDVDEEKTMTHHDMWLGIYEDLEASMDVDADALQSATILCLGHLGATIAKQLFHKYHNLASMQQQGNDDDTSDERSRIEDELEEDEDYELLVTVLQRFFHLVSADISLRTRNRVTSSINGLTHMALTAPTFVVPLLIDHLIRDTGEYLTEGELLALQSVIEPLEQQLLESVVPRRKALLLVNKFIAIVDGTAEFVSLPAQKAALQVIGEVGLLAGNRKVPDILSAVLRLLHNSENTELQNACEVQLTLLFEKLPKDHPIVSHLQSSVTKGMHHYDQSKR